jgi:lysophospholipase L1-like esterase
VAATRYTTTDLTIEINMTDNQQHQVALYAVDWDSTARVQRVEIQDWSTGAVLDTRTLSGFNGGHYLVWRIGGRVRLRVTNVAGGNAVVSGLFFDHAVATSSPFVAVTSPSNGTAVNAFPIALAADASDPDGSVSRVEFYANAALVGADSSSPFTFSWGHPPPGDYAITARAVDNAGAATLSTPSFVEVSGGAPRLMPLGDSITDGWQEPGAYRIELSRLLLEAGRPVDFVGSLVNGPESLPDKDHEGHNGWRIQDLAAAMNPWLDANQPDVVLLMIGTNDVLSNRDLPNAPTRLSALIDQVLSRVPSATVFVAAIPRLQNPVDDQEVQDYNAAVPGVVQAKRNAGLNVHFVDQYPAVAANQLPDGVHPDAAAHRNIAANWFTALSTVVFGNSPPTVHVTAPSAGTAVDPEATLTLRADASDSGGTIAQVEFLVGQTVVATDSTAPYEATWTATAPGLYDVRARAVDNAGAFTLSDPVRVTVNGQVASATFVAVDTNRQGNWRGFYGAEGYTIVNHATTLPAYATVLTTGAGAYTWASSTSDVRALQHSAGTGRIASTWFASGAFTVDVSITDGQHHRVTLYGVDWDSSARAQRVEVLDAGTGQVLDAQTLTSFNAGRYLTWRVRGHVQFRVTRLGGSNGVISGLFFDPN